MFTDESTFTSMQLLSIFYMMLRFVSSSINTHDDDCKFSGDVACTSVFRSHMIYTVS